MATAEIALAVTIRPRWGTRVNVVSPVRWRETVLADWIVADRLPVRFQVQLHQLLWNDEPGR